MFVPLRSGWNDATLVQAGSAGALVLACAASVLAPALYWLLLGAAVAGGVGFLIARHPIPFCVAWLAITGCTLEMTLNDLIGPAAFQSTIAVVKGSGLTLAAICAWRYGPRLDLLNPAWGFAAMALAGFMNGVYPGLTPADSLRSLLGSAAPYAFSFARVPPTWARAIIRTTVWCPITAVGAAAVVDAAGLHPMFVDSGGWRLAGLGHPAFLAGVCLPAIYAGLIELWRDGRGQDQLLLAANFVILVLTGARAPLAYALAVTGLTLLAVPSPRVPARARLLIVLGAAMVVPVLVLFAGDLTTVRLFNVLTTNFDNLSGREYLWPSFERAAAGAPWFGWGLGAGNVVISPESQIAQMLHTWAAHNEYLRIEVEGGQVGRGALILLFAAWSWRGTAVLALAERRIMRLVFAAFAAHAFTDNVLISTTACVLFTFVVAVFARGRAEAEQSRALPGAARKA